jgi:hypothetical protein
VNRGEITKMSVEKALHDDDLPLHRVHIDNTVHETFLSFFILKMKPPAVFLLKLLLQVFQITQLDD